MLRIQKRNRLFISDPKPIFFKSLVKIFWNKYISLRTGSNVFLHLFRSSSNFRCCEICGYNERFKTNFIISFIAVGSGIQYPRSGINIQDPQNWYDPESKLGARYTECCTEKCLTDPVDVVLAVVGIIVVDDKLDVVHVQTAGRHVCGHQNTRGSGPAQTETIK
jgi:hypothetical protein